MIKTRGHLGRPIEILLVEDSPTDAELTQHALSAGKVSNHLHVVEDGERAMEFLRREGEFADAPRPDLVLLDLNLPRKSGREVLADIRQDQRLRGLVVVVLTTSQDEQDVCGLWFKRQCLRNQASRSGAVFQLHPSDRSILVHCSDVTAGQGLIPPGNRL